ncbi:iron transporter [Actinoplanes sp. NPDC026619]|uniref:iron transporter n=1 Tax=Actinoplanes sp. NPDC026619 TaxID=3155798 RepID=UPI0033CAD537
MTTHATTPPMRNSNEADDDQLKVAERQGDAYGNALQAMAEEDGAVTCRAGDYLVAFINEKAEGMYELDGDRLIWREAAPRATAHLEVAVADAADGRFVPGLEVHVEVTADGRPLVSTELPFLWHPFLYHYGSNAQLPGEGPYDVTVRIGAPHFMRHDPVNGKRYAEPVTARFEKVRFASGRKLSPDASPRGADAPTAGAGGS